MEIVDAARVIEPITVVSLKENEESWRISTHGMYYWRQTYHFLTNELSVSLLRTTSLLLQKSDIQPPQPPKTHCICNRPVCPDDVLVRCTNPQCALLLHGRCIEDATLNKLRLQLQQPDTPLIRPLSEINLRGPSSTGQNGAAADYATQIIISQRSQAQGRKRVGCTDVRADRHWERDIECLGCGTRIQ